MTITTLDTLAHYLELTLALLLLILAIPAVHWLGKLIRKELLKP